MHRYSDRRKRRSRPTLPSSHFPPSLLHSRPCPYVCGVSLTNVEGKKPSSFFGVLSKPSFLFLFLRFSGYKKVGKRDKSPSHFRGKKRGGEIVCVLYGRNAEGEGDFGLNSAAAPSKRKRIRLGEECLFGQSRSLSLISSLLLLLPSLAHTHTESALTLLSLLLLQSNSPFFDQISSLSSGETAGGRRRRNSKLFL